MNREFIIEFEQETDGRWIEEIPELPGVLVYAETKKDAGEKVKSLAKEVIYEELQSIF